MTISIRSEWNCTVFSSASLVLANIAFASSFLLEMNDFIVSMGGGAPDESRGKEQRAMFFLIPGPRYFNSMSAGGCVSASSLLFVCGTIHPSSKRSK